MKAYKLFDPITRQFFFSRSVIFDEPSLFEKQQHHDVHNFQKNVQINNLTQSHESQIENYGGPITRSISKQSQDNEHQNEAGVTHYLHNAPILYLEKDTFTEVSTPQRSSVIGKLESIISTNQSNQTQSTHKESDLHESNNEIIFPSSSFFSPNPTKQQKQISYRDILIKDLDSLPSRSTRRWRIKGRALHPDINESQHEDTRKRTAKGTGNISARNGVQQQQNCSQRAATTAPYDADLQQQSGSRSAVAADAKRRRS
jgi:hypothetical protein